MCVNVIGLFLLVWVVGWEFCKLGGGVIVNVSLNCGKVGYFNMLVYNVLKVVVLGLICLLLMEWVEYGINVNVVCLGGVDMLMFEDVVMWLLLWFEVFVGELFEGMGVV